MEKKTIGGMNVLSDDELLDVVGGISEAEYAAIRQKLDAAVSRDDFAAFSAIVCENTSFHGRELLERVACDYTKSGYLTSYRFSDLTAAVVKNT